MHNTANNNIPENSNSKKTIVGALEWFRVGEYEQVERALHQLKEVSINELRTGISWADYFTDNGKEWYDWLIPTLAKNVNVLPCFLYTPPSIGIKPKTSSPPKNPKDYADFLDVMVTKYDEYFEWVELWNEPNNRSEYDYTLDRQWKIFCEMITGAAYWMQRLGKKTLLGGMSPIDPNWLQLIYDRGVMQHIDAIGIHGFPNVFDSHWPGWKETIDSVQAVIDYNNGRQELWITEAGFSTWQHDEKAQLREFIDATSAPAKRMYWYSLNDLDAKLPTVDGFHHDEREYNFGLVKKDGTPKLLYRLLKQHGPKNIHKENWLTQPQIAITNEKIGHKAVITGGAGFIGTNLADSLLAEGKSVLIFDNLSRDGVENNLKWLKNKYNENVSVEIADVRNEHAVNNAIKNADSVYHFAAQVAVTTSCTNPFLDFEVNARGTVNVLEAIRHSEKKPPLLFTSTNKVYGGLEDLKVVLKRSRYEPEDEKIAAFGVAEQRNIDFHSPYGCSKGAADSYVLDYTRTFGLSAVIFRMSCIYGPHQFGTEDQGWVAHFLISALKGNPVTLYGDGRQVRDILYVADLINAMKIAQADMKDISGQAFNIGGGSKNSISLMELISMIVKLQSESVELDFGAWRQGDQKYYVSDFRKFQLATGWKPNISAKQGIKLLYQWLADYHNVSSSKKIYSGQVIS